MNFNHLAIFHAVAGAGSVSGGAAALMIGQPAASRQLKLLERAVGAELLTRTPKGVRLTAAGEVLAEYAAKIFTLADEATAAVEDLRGLERGRLRIGASPTIGTYLLPDVLVRFQRRFPRVRTRAEVLPGSAVRDRLLAGEMDVGLGDEADRADGLTAAPFMVERFAAIVPAGHPLTGRTDVTAAAFLAEAFVAQRSAGRSTSFVERELQKRGLLVSPALAVEGTEAVKKAVAAGLGASLVPRLAIELELAAGRLATVPLVDLELTRPLLLLRRAGEAMGKPARAFHCLLERVVNPSDS